MPFLYGRGAASLQGCDDAGQNSTSVDSIPPGSSTPLESAKGAALAFGYCSLVLVLFSVSPPAHCI